MDENTINKIRNFGALNYAPERIADLLGYAGEDRKQLFIQLADEKSEAHIAYLQGQSIGKYNIDAQLAKQAERGDADSVKLLQDRQNDETISNLKKELFGIV